MKNIIHDYYCYLFSPVNLHSNKSSEFQNKGVDKVDQEEGKFEFLSTYGSGHVGEINMKQLKK